MKILASDFDETIYFPEDIEKTKNNVKYIKEFISYGNIFCIITGRNYTDLKQFLNNFDIPYSYLICEDGAKIFNNVDYCLDTILLEENEIKEVVKILEEEKCDYYLDDGYNKTEYYNDCVKIVINCTDEEDKERLVKLIKDKVNIHIYASRTHINIIHKTVNKENAIKKLFNLEHLDYNKLHVIGDNDNDYEMIKAFNGVVMENHHEKLNELNKEEYKTLSDYIKELMNN